MVTEQEIEDWKWDFLAENIRSRRTAMAFEFVDRLVAENHQAQERLKALVEAAEFQIEKLKKQTMVNPSLRHR